MRVEERQRGPHGRRSRGPGERVSVHIQVTDRQESESETQPDEKHDSLSTLGRGFVDRAKRVADRNNSDPRNERIGNHQVDIVRERDLSPLMEYDPDGAECSERVGLNAVEQVVSEDHHEADGGNHSRRKEHHQGEEHEARAKRPVDNPRPVVEVELQKHAILDNGEFKDQQPDPAAEQEPEELQWRFAASTRQIRPRSHQEAKRWRAKVSDPARHVSAERGDVGVKGIESRFPKVPFRVVEGHEDDDESAKDVDRVESRFRAGRGGRHVVRRRGRLDELGCCHVRHPSRNTWKIRYRRSSEPLSRQCAQARR